LSLRIKDVDPYAENLISGLIFYQVAYSLLNLSDKKPAYYFQDPESLCFVGYETKVKEGKDFYFAISKRNSDGSISEGSGFFAIIKD
ncbi:MAG: hypothetical protein NTX57_11920, partial [Armatimonadetes bacterium]|nr:hypothetical protein [Armatimonadota bacterium]